VIVTVILLTVSKLSLERILVLNRRKLFVFVEVVFSDALGDRSAVSSICRGAHRSCNHANIAAAANSPHVSSTQVRCCL
jgi:hypothetical protein